MVYGLKLEFLAASLVTVYILVDLLCLKNYVISVSLVSIQKARL